MVASDRNTCSGLLEPAGLIPPTPAAMSLTGSQTTPLLQQSPPRKQQPSRHWDSAASQRWPTVRQRAWLAQRHRLATSACSGHGAAGAGSEFRHSRVRQGNCNCTRQRQLREHSTSRPSNGRVRQRGMRPMHGQLVHPHSKYTHTAHRPTAQTCSIKVCCRQPPIQVDQYPAKEHNRETETGKTRRLQGRDLQASLQGSILNTPYRHAETDNTTQWITAICSASKAGPANPHMELVGSKPQEKAGTLHVDC